MHIQERAIEAASFARFMASSSVPTTPATSTPMLTSESSIIMATRISSSTTSIRRGIAIEVNPTLDAVSALGTAMEPASTP